MEILEITPDLVPEVCEFLAAEIGHGICAAEFPAVFEPRWSPGPLGFALLAHGTVAGALATIRSTRFIGGRRRQVCNLSSWAVASSFRMYAPALLQRAIAQPDTIFTNFTASPPVAEILRAFRFVEVPAEERVQLPFAPRPRRTATWQVDADGIETALRTRGQDEAADIVRDHRATRAKWVLVDTGRGCCALALHLMRVKRLPFAYVLYCSAPQQFVASLGALRQACAKTWGWHLIAWPRALFGTAVGTVPVRRPQPVLFKGNDVKPGELDGLYTELTLLPILR